MDTDSGLEKKKMTELESMNHLFYHFMDESLKYALLGGTFGFLAGAVLKRPKFGLLFGTGFAYGKCVHKYSLQFAQFQETVIVGDYVAIAVFSENPYAFLIKDKLVADSYRKHFNLLWRMTKN